MTSADWIALQVRVDEQDRLLRASGHREAADVMQAVRREAYAAKDALHQIRGLIKRQIGDA
jgi:hypothetical protein